MTGISKPVEGPFRCSNCGAAKPDSTTWPQACPVCRKDIWTTTVSFTADEVAAARGRPQDCYTTGIDPSDPRVKAAVDKIVQAEAHDALEEARTAAILDVSAKVIRVATAIADTIDESRLAEKDRWLVDELRSALEDLRAVP